MVVGVSDRLNLSEGTVSYPQLAVRGGAHFAPIQHAEIMTPSHIHNYFCAPKQLTMALTIVVASAVLGLTISLPARAVELAGPPHGQQSVPLPWAATPADSTRPRPPQSRSGRLTDGAGRPDDPRQPDRASQNQPGAVKPYQVSTWPDATQWGPPVTMPMTVVRDFAPPARPWLPGHRGVDLATAVGGVVYAPADGSISFAGFVVDRAIITVLHTTGHKSSFEAATASLGRGTQVTRGQPIGHKVASPKCPGCVHWGVRDPYGNYVDPLTVPEVAPAILLPWQLGGPSVSQLTWH